MKINLQNYEEYFVRYLDGELSSQETGEVELFLQQYPELNSELSAFKSTVLSVDEEIFFPRKESLKKGISLVNYEDYFIRKVENTLSSQEEIDLASFLKQHSELQREMNAFRATKLVADSSVIFPDKNLLKKREGRVVPIYVRYIVATAIAASLILIVMMRGINVTDQPDISSIAHQPSPVSSSPKTEEQSRKNEDETKNQLTSVNSELASTQSVNSAKKNFTNEHKKERSVSKEDSTQLADASFPNNSKSSVTSSQTNSTPIVENEIAMLGTGLQPISYQARFKKAHYRMVPVMIANTNSVAAESKPTKFSSVASSLGSELLRLSGREDYLKTTSAFNTRGNEKKNLPWVLNIKGKKFDFYHKFFKKRNRSSSEPKQN